ncbi:2-oxo acid dehydrogenase subunit E2 [uncultured Flavonifractor sp.]|uniref:2-oxo acid dehydrogenase subunit E2 n=1 Tax=uncultured Flavonifractor sp. TaxID=1193534 RepID=UPI00261E1786|nr:2-oxo acid dehydrogenase subunit E2 [uncultured Flavonifractor sp.]
MAEHDEQGRLIREIRPLEGMRKVIAERMTFSKHEYPQGTGQVRLSVDKLIQFRKELLEQKGIKVSFGDLYVKAAACALEENMALNASRQKERIIYYEDINLTVQATINGVLMEPVVEHADRKDIEEISAELKKTYDYIRRGKLMRVKLEGGTFSVSNLGASLIDSQQPFISPPQGAIFGINRNCRVPMFDENDNIVPVNLTTFALTIDHGLCDGAEVVNFFASLNKVLQDPWTWMYHKRSAPEEG